jgi:hypothetical protein
MNDANLANFEQHYLVQLPDQQRKNLCYTAKARASLDGTDAKIAEKSFPDEYSVTYSDGRIEEHVVAILCETIPQSYLRLGDSNTQITILLKKNKFDAMPYTFYVEMMKSVSKPNTGTGTYKLFSLSPPP